MKFLAPSGGWEMRGRWKGCRSGVHGKVRGDLDGDNFGKSSSVLRPDLVQNVRMCVVLQKIEPDFPTHTQVPLRRAHRTETEGHLGRNHTSVTPLTD